MTNQTNTHQPHVLPLRTYLTVAGALFVLTAVTYGVSFIHLGEFNIIVALLIATVKASIVALIFMHLKYDNKLFMTVFVSAIVFLGLFLSLTMLDTMHRGDIDPIKDKPINDRAVFYQNK